MTIKKYIFIVIIIFTLLGANLFIANNYAMETNENNIIEENEIDTDYENTVEDEETNVQNTNEVSNEVSNSINNIVENNTVANSTNTTNTSNTENTNNTSNSTNVENNSNTASNTSENNTTSEQTTVTPVITYSTHVQNKGWTSYVKDGKTSGTTGKNLKVEAIKIKIDGLDDDISIKYQAHVQDVGWQSWKSDGQTAGTTGKNLRMEAIKIRLESTDEYSVTYRVYVQNAGWQDWVTDGDIAGTTGKGLRIEAIQIKIIDKVQKGNLSIESPTKGTTVYNRDSVTVSGWKMSNVSNSYIKVYLDGVKQSYSVKYSKRSDIIDSISGYGTIVENPKPGFSFTIDTSSLDAGIHTVKIKLYSSDGTSLKSASTTFIVDNDLHVSYSTHVQDKGWVSSVMDGTTSGTTGKSKRVEAIKINLLNAGENAKIKYRVHVQNVGWQDWTTDGEIAGTTGRSLRVEAIQIKLVNMDDYTVEYKVHIQDVGWTDWYIDGETAGTTGKSKRIEAIQIRIVDKYKRKYLGVDVSKYNGTIDWSKVKKSGIDFVMIRVGYRGYGSAGTIVEDSNFVTNITGAKAAGLKVGVYFVTQATTTAEAKEEAKWVINKIKGYSIDYPVAIDVEQSSSPTGTGRADNLDKSTRTSIIKKFCSVIEDSGYTPIIYLNKNWATNYVNMSKLTAYDTWIAHYTNNINTKTDYSGSYTMWQYTSSGSVSGISGNVDLDVCYKKY